MSSPLFGRLSARLESARNDDGGFGPRPGLPSEPEPTALATLALDDDAGRAWLAGHQRPDGSLALVIGDRVNPPDESVNDSATSLAALAMPAGAAREKALDYIVAHQAVQLSSLEPGRADGRQPPRVELDAVHVRMDRAHVAQPPRAPDPPSVRDRARSPTR